MKILVTGAAGFLGSGLAHRFVEKNDPVYAAVRANTALHRLADIRSAITMVQINLEDQNSIENTLAQVQPEAVIHCAAYGVRFEDQDAQKAIATNILGTYHLVRASARSNVKRFLHVGSCFEYGNKPRPICETEVLEPTGIYGVTKAAASLMALEEGRARGLPLAVVRPFGLWGEGENKDRLVPQVVRACVQQTPLELTPCEQIRDYTQCSRMTEHIAQLLKMPVFPAGQIINAGSGVSKKLKQFVLEIAGVLKGEQWMQFGKLPYRPGEMMTLTPDISRLKRYIPVLENFSDDLAGDVQKMATQVKREFSPEGRFKP